MKSMRKFCTVLLALFMILGTIGFSAVAEENAYNGGKYTYTLTEGKASITGYSYCFEDPYLSDCIVIPEKLDGYTVVAIDDNAFAELDYFKSIELPDTIEIIGDGAFRYCSCLEEVVLSEKLKSIGEAAFSNCGQLKSINIPASVENIGDYVFEFCSNLESINVHEDNAFFISENGVLFNKEKTNILVYPAKCGMEKYEIPVSVTEIGTGAFNGNTFIKEIVIPESVQKIGTSAFNNCRSLEKINIPDGIQQISLNMFYYCVALDNVIVPDSVTEICRGGFAGCHSLKNIVMSKNVTSIGNSAFDECAALEEIDLGDNLTYIGTSAFNYCLKLTNIEIPEGVESLSGTFSRCDSLKEITIPTTVKVVGYHTFSYCGALENIIFEEGVTELQDYAVVGCRSLKSVTLPSTLDKIGLRAFAEDTQLTDVYFMGSEADWENIEIAEGNEPLLNAEIHFAVSNIKGDINNDEIVNSSDALAVLKHAVKSEELTGSSLEKADVNGDGIVNSSDALEILRISVGLDDSEPTSKEDIVALYNDGVEKMLSQENFTAEFFVSQYDAKVNKFMINGGNDSEMAQSYEEYLQSVEFEEEVYTFVNGYTEEGYCAEEIFLLGVSENEVNTAKAVPHGEGYKITITLNPQKVTYGKDELPEGYESYSEEFLVTEILAVTDGEGRIVLMDLYIVDNIIESYTEMEFVVHVDYEISMREIITFEY